MDAKSSSPTSVRSSHIGSSSHNRSGSADTQSNGGPPKRHALRIYFRARTAPPAASAQGRLRGQGAGPKQELLPHLSEARTAKFAVKHVKYNGHDRTPCLIIDVNTPSTASVGVQDVN